MVRLPAAAAAMMAPRVSPAFQNLPRTAVAPPSIDDVKRHMYGSVEKFDAANRASIDEARQRDVELRARAPMAPPVQLPPVGLQYEDMEPPTQYEPQEDIEEVPEGGDADEIEEAAEYGEEEAFEGWNVGMDERIVGVARRGKRQNVPITHVRQRQRRVQRMQRGVDEGKRRGGNVMQLTRRRPNR